MFSAPLGENVITDRVYKDCPIVVCGKTMCAKLAELPMNNFDVSFASIFFIVIILVLNVIVVL